MIDLHTHILPGVDDGAEDLDTALAIAREAEKQGIRKMVATPHYLEDGYQLSPDETEDRVDKLQHELNVAGIDVEVLPGAEVFITSDLSRKVSKGLVPTINYSRYILIELPMRKIPPYTSEVLYDLKVMGFVPVICHPERYSPIMEDPNILYHWVKEGIYAQVNASSLLGVFGSKVQETAELLVKHNLVQVIGSDVHSTGRRRECLEEGMEVLEELIGPEAERFINNGHLIAQDRELNILPPHYFEKEEGVLTKVKKFFKKRSEVFTN